MSQCSFQSSLDSYYDGQARPESARELERHVPTCAACKSRLDELRELSEILKAALPKRIRPDELARLHEAVDGLEDRSVLRLVTGLSAIAASILIISGAWLYDGPVPASRPISFKPAPEQTWERMAGGGAIPEPAGARPSGTAMRDTTNWMIHSMGGAAEHDSR